LEEAAGVKGQAKYVIYREKSDDSGLWRIHAIVRQGPSSKGCLQFPKSWRGREQSDLIEVCGVPESVSVAADGCNGICASRESAVGLAKISVASVLMRHSFMDIEVAEEDEEESSETLVQQENDGGSVHSVNASMQLVVSPLIQPVNPLAVRASQAPRRSCDLYGKRASQMARMQIKAMQRPQYCLMAKGLTREVT